LSREVIGSLACHTAASSSATRGGDGFALELDAALSLPQVCGKLRILWRDRLVSKKLKPFSEVPGNEVKDHFSSLISVVVYRLYPRRVLEADMETCASGFS
jgi:hypothetical protein